MAKHSPLITIAGVVKSANIAALRFTLFEKLLGTNNHEKRSLNNFYRVAGGNKPMPYDHEYQHKNHTQ